MTDLTAHLRALIRIEGPITVARYMAEALSHPEHGYYMRGDPLGAAGDFVTSPEISQVFGELLGLWTVVTWQAMDRPAAFHLTELGPGRGTLMADALRAMRQAPEPGAMAAAAIHLVESSPALRRVQRERLGAQDVHWHDRFWDLPPGPIVLLANEFFDALPVHQLERAAEGWRERLVHWDDGRRAFRFVLSGTPSPLAAALPEGLRGAAAGTVAEVCPAAIALARDIGERVARDGGAALIIDYGRTDGAGGATLQSVRRHQSHAPLAAPGDADLTAHVDFAALAGVGRDAGARVHGPVDQGEFLCRLGIEARAERLAAAAGGGQAEDVRRGCRRLIDSAEMGTLFKVMCLAHPDLPPPAGFEGEP